jgi:transcriptional regulator with XRE-family HTH domain
MATTTPPIRRQLIGTALRHYREAFGGTLSDAAAILRCDKSRITRIETGERGIRPGELRVLLEAYGAGEDDRETLVTMASPSGTAGWWSSHDVLSDADREYLSLEALSVQALHYSPLGIPELLQAPAYAEARNEADLGMATTGTPSPVVEAILARQDAILDGTRDLQAVITEAALHQAVGRHEVMRQQAAHLTGLAEERRVDIHVLPFGALAHPAPSIGAVSVLRFSATAGISVAHVPGITTGQFLTGKVAARCARTFDQLRASALPHEESIAFLRSLGA